MAPKADRNGQTLEQALSPKQIDLIRSTYKVIGEVGVRRLSLQNVADEARVSKGIVLYYFKTKERLILTTMRWVLHRVAQRIRQALSQTRSPQEQIVSMIDTIFVDAQANRKFYLAYLDMLEYGARVHQFGDLSNTFQSIVNALYADVIAAGAAEDVFHVENVEEAASIVRALVDGLFIQWLQEREWAEWHPRYRERCKRAVLTYLRLAPIKP